MLRLILILVVLGEAGLVGINFLLFQNGLYSFIAGMAMLMGLANVMQAFMYEGQRKQIEMLKRYHFVYLPPLDACNTEKLHVN